MFFKKHKEIVENLTKEIEALKRDHLILYKSLEELTNLIKETRKEISDTIHKQQEPNDLIVYNLKDGIEISCPLVPNIPKKDIENAKMRMRSYTAAQESRLKDMEAFKKVLEIEAQEGIDEIRRKYQIDTLIPSNN